MFFRTSVFLVIAAACAVAQNVYPSDFSGASAGSFASSSAGASSMDFVQDQPVVGHPVHSIGAVPYAASPVASFTGDDVDSFSAHKTQTVTSVQQAKPASRIFTGAHVSPVPSRIELPGVSHVSSGLAISPSLPAILLAFPSVSYSLPSSKRILAPVLGAHLPSAADHIAPTPQFAQATAAPEITKTVKTTVTEIARSKDNLQTVPDQAVLRGTVVPVTSGVYRPGVSTVYRPVVSESYGVSPVSGKVATTPFVRSSRFGANGASTAGSSATTAAAATSSSATSFSSSSSQSASTAI